MASLAEAKQSKISKERLVNTFEKGLREHSEFITYGPEEVAKAAAWGCIEHLLTVQTNLPHGLTAAIRDAGGSIHVYDSDSDPVEHVALMKQFTGTVAILRFPMTDESADDFDDDTSDSDDEENVILNPAIRHCSQTHYRSIKDTTLESQCLTNEPLKLPELLPWNRSTESYLDEDVEDELEAINEIFPSEGSDIPETRAAVLRASVNECYLLVRDTDSAKAACLKVRLPQSYLSSSDMIQISLESAQGITDPSCLVSKCREFVTNFVSKSDGEPVLYELVEFISGVVSAD